MMARRLHKSRNRLVLGVAGGIADYFNVDPVIAQHPRRQNRKKRFPSTRTGPPSKRKVDQAGEDVNVR